MPLFILTETSAGYALLKAKDKKLLQREGLSSGIETADQICSELRLKDFQKFDSAAEALEEVSALVESKVSPRLASLLNILKDEKKASLAVADPKLGTAIHKLPGLSIIPVSDSTTADLYRSIKEHLPSLIPGLLPNDLSTMSLGLSHSLSRHKLRFSPDKIDTMVVQAVALLDDLDKELNTYAMRVKEWYGWHFPEMAKIVNDNIAYARIIIAMGMRSNAASTDLSDVLPEEIEGAVKAAAEVSMGTEITKEDLDHIKSLAEQVVGFTEYRQTLSSYLSSRMRALAPNLTALVGDLVGARLIAHSGSLMNLAKSPASTVQILGAEKALFRALKTKHDTPKYGLIYHATLVGRATGKNKGKIARVLAAKAAIGIRADAYANWGVDGTESIDAVSEEMKSALGTAARLKVERRLAGLEGKPLRMATAVAPQEQPAKWEIKEARKYNPDADGLVGTEPAATRSSPVQTKLPKREKKAAAQPASDDSDVSDESDDDEQAKRQIESELYGDSSSTAKGTAVSPEIPDDQHSLSASVSDEAPNGTKASKKSSKKERKGAKEQQKEVAANAAKAGLSVSRYLRKIERGEIKWVDGEPVAISKKEIKKAKKAEEKAAAQNGDKKRKRDDDDEKTEKKKKKKDRKEKK